MHLHDGHLYNVKGCGATYMMAGSTDESDTQVTAWEVNGDRGNTVKLPVSTGDMTDQVPMGI